MERLDYDDFEVVLEGDADAMTAHVATSPVGPSRRVPFVLPGIADQSLKVLVLTLRATRGARALENDVSTDVRRYGDALFTALFHDESLTTLRSSLQVSSKTGHGLRIRIRYADMPALANVPWELLYDKQRHWFLCQYPKYPVVRFVDVPEDVRPLSIRGAVRMLVVISSPTDLLNLDVEEEWRRLSTAVGPLVDSGQLVVDRVPVATLEAVRQAVTATDYHVFHFIGHGGFDAQTGDGTLAFTDKYGRYRPETGHDLGVILAASPIRLAVLNSCEGARVSDLDPYAGTAASLVELGIPAIVAMQFEISDEAAIAFSAAMYTALMSGHTVDLAVTLARQAILTTSRSEWATPVLYLRASDGVLFDLGREAVPLKELSHALPAVVAEAEIASRVVTDGPKPPPPPDPPPDPRPDPPPDPPSPTWPRWRVVVAALVALLVAGGIGWAAVAQPFGADDTAPNPTTTVTPTPSPTPLPPSPSPSPTPSPPPPSPSPTPTPTPTPAPKPADLGVSVKKAVDDGTKVATLSYSVVNRGGMASTGRTLVIAVPAPGKVTSSTCKSTGSGKYQCTLGTIAAGKTVLAAITVAVPATPIGAFSVVATVTPGDGGAGADSQTTPLTCSCTATTTTTTAPPAPTNT